MAPEKQYGYVYIIDCGNGDWKIGSTGRLLNRIKAHRSYYGDDASVISITKFASPALAFQVENWVHCWLWEHHHHREFFTLGWMTNDRTAVAAFCQRLSDFYKNELHLLIMEPTDFFRPVPVPSTDPLVTALESSSFWHAPGPLPQRPFHAMNRWSLSRQVVQDNLKLGNSRAAKKMWANFTAEQRNERVRAIKTALNKPESLLRRSAENRRRMSDPAYRLRATQGLKNDAKSPEGRAARSDRMRRQRASPGFVANMQAGLRGRFKSRGVSPNQLTLFGEDAVMLNFHPTADTQPNAYDCMDFLNYTDLGFARERGGPLPGDRSWFRLFAYVGDLNASTTTICQTLYIVDDRIDNVLAYMWECWKPGLQWLMEEAQKAGYIPGDPAPIHPRTENGLLREGFAVSSRVVQLEQKPRSVTENCFERYVA